MAGDRPVFVAHSLGAQEDNLRQVSVGECEVSARASGTDGQLPHPLLTGLGQRKRSRSRHLILLY